MTLCCHAYNKYKCIIYDNSGTKKGEWSYIEAVFLNFTGTQLVLFWNRLWYIKMHIVISGATIKKIKRTKSLSFEKIIQVDKNLATLTKKMREDTNYQNQEGKKGYHCQTYKWEDYKKILQELNANN